MLTNETVAAGLELAGKATARPWITKWNGNTVKSIAVVSRLSRHKICASISPKTTDAAYIVEACNNYPDALREIQELREQVADVLRDRDGIYERLVWSNRRLMTAIRMFAVCDNHCPATELSTESCADYLGPTCRHSLINAIYQETEKQYREAEEKYNELLETEESEATR